MGTPDALGPPGLSGWAALTRGSPDESPGYLEQHGQQLYYVLHRGRPAEPAPAVRPGAVLVAGGFACERAHTYAMLVRWARFLAAHGHDVLRFDYRGVGESTGEFAELGLEDWYDDLLTAERYLQQQSGQQQVALHGVSLGGLLAARAFAQGHGAALLLWAAPQSAREMLHAMLRYRLAEDFALAPVGHRRGREDYIADLEAGRGVEVEGYRWSPRLWAEAAHWKLDLPAPAAPGNANPGPGRPWRAVELPALPGYLLTGPGRAPMPDPRPRYRRPLNPDLSDWFHTNLAWLGPALGAGTGG